MYVRTGRDSGTTGQRQRASPPLLLVFSRADYTLARTSVASSSVVTSISSITNLEGNGSLQRKSRSVFPARVGGSHIAGAEWNFNLVLPMSS
jgi:hypothetical protein